MKLSDKYFESGNTLEGFKKAISDMSARIQYIPLNLKNAVLLNYQTTTPDGQMLFHYIDPENIFKKSNDISFLHNVRKNETDFFEKIPKELFEEAIKNQELLLYYDAKIFLVSNHTFMTLSQKIGLPGVTNLEGVVRDCAIAQRFHEMKKGFNVQLVAREESGCNKVYAIASKCYKSTPQTILMDIIDTYMNSSDIGECVVKNWRVDNFFTEIYLEFPEMAADFKQLYNLEYDVIPGIELSTSDTLDCSVTVTGTFRLKDNKYSYPLETMKEKHLGNKTDEQILEMADNEILATVRKLPERLVELLGIDIASPDIPLEKVSGQQKNLASYKKALKTVMKFADVEKAIGKKRMKPLLEEMLAEINPAEKYTAYDVVMHVIGIPDRIELPDNAMRIMQKACGKAPYAPFEVINNTNMEDTGILLPA